MSFNSRRYYFYLIFADTIKNKEPWIKQEWANNIQPLLDKILKQSPSYKKTGLTTIQYTPKPNSKYFEEVKFGRLSWDDKSVEKWTLTPIDESRKFCYIDCWTPMRSVCSKEDKAPDVYFSISNQKFIHVNSKLQFDLFVVIAIAEDIAFNPDSYIIELSKKLNSKKTVYVLREWGQHKEKEDSWEFTNSIQDTTSFGIYKKGTTLNLHDTEFDNIDFSGWKVLYDSQ